jgi:hypothetical protein
VNQAVKVVLGVALALATTAIVYLGAQRILEQQRISDEIARLRDGLYRARITADRCQRSLASVENELQVFDARLDSMRARVDSFEALDVRGVAQEQYQMYLGIFEAYNDSVDAWGVHERQLRAADVSCRNVILDHNSLRDSLQQVLADLRGG